jgi:hydrogenase expression/formation protein HypE
MKLAIGKLYSTELERLCLSHLPLADPRETQGLDYAFASGDEKIVIANDPVIGVPLDTYGHFAVHYSAGDVACSGVNPRYLNLGIYMPPETTSEWLMNTCKALGNEAKRFELKVLGGHTGVYHGLSQPLISTACIAFRTAQNPHPKIPKQGDQILMVGTYGYEFAWFLSRTAPEILENLASPKKLRSLKRDLSPFNVISPALLAWKSGGKFVHDITEGGLSAALIDLSRQAHLGLTVRANDVPLEDLGKNAVQSVGGDLFSTSSFGCILVVVDPEKREQVETSFIREGYRTACIGEFKQGSTLSYLDDASMRPIQRGIDAYTFLTQRL